MSRISIGRRLDRLFEYHRPGDSLAGRVSRLSPEDRERYNAFRTTNDRILDAAGPDAFERWLSGEIVLDELPSPIRHALFPEQRAIDALALNDPAAAWTAMLMSERKPQKRSR